MVCLLPCGEEKGKAILDVDCFEQLKALGGKYGAERVYSDFNLIYHKTSNDLNPKVVEEIKEITKKYDPSDQLSIEKLFTILYATVIAEENRKLKKTPRGFLWEKKSRRFGVYQLRDMEPNMLQPTARERSGGN